MRADRLISILMLLQTTGGMTGKDLAKRLEVSERTIHRDMVVLSAAGIPVTADRGAGGGWCLLGDYRTNLTGLNEKEVLSLFIPQSERILSDLGLAKNSKSVFLKLLSTLPGEYQRSAQYMQERIYVDTVGWWETEKSSNILPILQEAIWKEQKLRFTYRRSDKISERVMSPLGLVSKGSIWYIIGIVDGDIKTYRISRIEDAVITGGAFPRPEEFNLEQYWKESSQQFIDSLPKYSAILKVENELLLKIKNRSYSKITDDMPAIEDNWSKIIMKFETELEAFEYILSLCSQVEVIEPDSLRQKIIDTANSIIILYR